MKNTGIIRKIDELGRIVIPKEIRKYMKISEGDEIEIYTNDESEIIFKKHTLFKGLEDDFFLLAKTLYENFKNTVIITDNENVICAYGPNSGIFIEQHLSTNFKKIIHGNDEFKGLLSDIVNSHPEFQAKVFTLNNGKDKIGSFCILEDVNPLGECEMSVIRNFSNFFVKKLKV